MISPSDSYAHFDGLHDVSTLLKYVTVKFADYPSFRRHLWITAEGWIYFGLALVEMLSHILPAARGGAEVFKVIDTVIGEFVP